MKKYVSTLILALLVAILLVSGIAHALNYDNNVVDHRLCPAGLVEIIEKLEELETIAYNNNNTHILVIVKELLRYINRTNISCIELLLVDNIIENLRKLAEYKFLPKNTSIYHITSKLSTKQKNLDRLRAIEPPYYTPINLRYYTSTPMSAIADTVVMEFSKKTNKGIYSWIDQENVRLNKTIYESVISINTCNVLLREDSQINPYILIVSVISLTTLLAVAVKLFRPKVNI